MEGHRGQPRAGTEKEVVHELGLHHAGDVGQARDDHHRVEQGRVVGGDDQRPRIAQAVEFLQVEAAGAEDFEEAQIEAKPPGDEAPPDRLRPALRSRGKT